MGGSRGGCLFGLMLVFVAFLLCTGTQVQFLRCWDRMWGYNRSESEYKEIGKLSCVSTTKRNSDGFSQIPIGPTTTKRFGKVRQSPNGETLGYIDSGVQINIIERQGGWYLAEGSYYKSSRDDTRFGRFWIGGKLLK